MLSFIVPAHNEQALIGRALTAIHHAAGTVDEPYEVIVVDDASTDATAEIARRHKATVISVGHRHIAATRNSGARAASGERLFFVDADTFISPQLLVAAVRALDKGAAGGGAPPRLDGPVPLYARLLTFMLSLVMRLASLSGGAFMFCTREAFDTVGGFDERLFGAEDAALSAALAREGRFVILWQRVLTSGRRARAMSGLQMLRLILRVAVTPSRLKNRSMVEGVWYDSNRDGDAVQARSLATRLSNFVGLLLIVAIFTGPLWAIPLPASLQAGWPGTIKYTVQIFVCHVGLIAWPCAYFLIINLIKQKRWVERVKLLLLIALCVWAGWINSREVYGFWTGFLR